MHLAYPHEGILYNTIMYIFCHYLSLFERAAMPVYRRQRCYVVRSTHSTFEIDLQSYYLTPRITDRGSELNEADHWRPANVHTMPGWSSRVHAIAAEIILRLGGTTLMEYLEILHEK